VGLEGGQQFYIVELLLLQALTFPAFSSNNPPTNMGMSNDLWVHMRMHRMTLHQFIVHILSSSCNSYAVYESTTDLETSAPKLLRIIPKFEHLKAQLLKTKNTTQSQHSYSIFLNRVALDAKHNLLARVFTKHRTKDPTKPCNSPSFYHVLSIYLTIYLSIYIYVYIYIFPIYNIYICTYTNHL
jgi:hypothetical protein